VPRVWAGIRRDLGAAPDARAPLLTADMRRLMEVLPEGLLGQRDRALLLVGFAGGFRRSELVSLNVADARFSREGLTLTLRRSKTDQEGQGRLVAIPHGARPATCPVRALQDWLAAANLTGGPLFRAVNRHGGVGAGRLSDKAVARVVKRTAARAGLDPARYSGHSLRAGLATSAAQGGADERTIMQQTGHASLLMVRRYIREGTLFRDNAAAYLGL
jgi:integrase